MKIQKKRSRWFLLLLSIPFIEFFFFRYFIHSILQIRIGWGPIMVDADLLIPGLFSYLIFLFAVTRNEIPKCELQWPWLYFNLFAMGSFFLINLFYPVLFSELGAIFTLFWWILAISFFTSSFFLFLPAKFYFERNQILPLVLCLTMASSIVLGKHFFAIFWKPLLSWFQLTTCPLVNFLHQPQEVFCKVAVGMKGYSVLRIQTQGFVAFFAKPCSGLDGFLFFGNLSILLWLKFQRKMSTLNWITTILCGLCLIFLINTFRIGFLFSLAYSLNRFFPLYGLTIFEWLFHNHAGWIFYTSFSIGYYWIILHKLNQVSQLRFSVPYPPSPLPT